MIRRKYAGGLKDLDGFSHVILLYHLHKPDGVLLVSDHHLNGAGILSSITAAGLFAHDRSFLGRMEVRRFNRVSRGD